MDKSRALNTLLEAADLVGMLEELSKGGSDRAAASLPGIRITLRSVRDRILASHDLLAREVINGAAESVSTRPQRPIEAGSDVSAATAAAERPGFRRRDLRASIEKSAE